MKKPEEIYVTLYRGRIIMTGTKEEMEDYSVQDLSLEDSKLSVENLLKKLQETKVMTLKEAVQYQLKSKDQAYLTYIRKLKEKNNKK